MIKLNNMKLACLIFLLVLNCSNVKSENANENMIQKVFKNLFLLSAINSLQLAEKQAMEERIRVSLAELESFASDKSCSADSVCKTIGVGDYNSCSGPASYIIFSKEKVYEWAFQKKIEVHNTLTRDYANKYLAGTATTCANNPVPSVLCVNGKCTNVSGGL